MNQYTMQRLVEVSRKLCSFREIDDTVQLVLDTAAELTKSKESSLLLFDEETGFLRFVAASWFTSEPDKVALVENIHIPIKNSIAGWVFEQAKPRIVHDAMNDPLIFKPVGQTLNSEAQSLIAAPLMFKGNTIGVIECINRQNGYYDEQSIAVLETLASLVSMAIYNTYMLEKSETAYQDLAELDRMKSDFIAITSHELRTPLGLILGHATMLQEMAEDPVNDQIQIIVRNAMRLKEIVEDLSAVNNMQSGKSRIRKSRLSIQTTIDELATKFEHQAGDKRINMTTRLDDDLLTVHGDEEKITLILQNLLKNAITFTNNGGKVVIVAERLSEYIKISVIDNGIGIPKRDLTRIFDRFFQVESHLNRHHGGLGLGLAVVRDMVEIHGGRIWVESVEGEGSNFSFLIPISEPEPEEKIPAFVYS